MTPEQAAAFVNAQAVAAVAEVQGMVAENQHRMACGNSIAYGEEAFAEIEGKYGLGHNTVCRLFADANGH